MDHDSGVLTQDLIYEAAEVPNKSTTLDEIKYIGLTDRYSDLSILSRLTNLQIASFRLCALQSFPEELFQLVNLRVIDLSGNQISVLPLRDKFSSLTNLYQLNLSNNKISNINELSKLDLLTNLKQLILTGNICLSPKDSFEQIAIMFPNLIVLNNSIITSQYRAFLQDIAKYNENFIVPFSKIDDYIFIYLKYIHSSTNDHYFRRSLAFKFCLSKVIRHFSAVEKIQSVYRGYHQRIKYKFLHQSAKYLLNFLHFWYQKRINAANRIRSTFLHFQLRQRIKRIRSARLIQAVWRGFMVRRLCLISIFEKDSKFVFFITSSHLRRLKSFLTKRNFSFPEEEVPSDYQKIRLIEPKKQRLPGSPIVYYTIDNSALIRPIKVKKTSTDSIWCHHDHSAMKMEMKVTKGGVNYSPQCFMSVISFTPYTKTIKPFKLPVYDRFLCCAYKDRQTFSSVIYSLCAEMPQRIRLFTERTIRTISSLLVIQSAFRTFLVRERTFKKIKREALEKRAARCIKHFLHSALFRASITHSLDVLHFFRSLPYTNVFYTTKGKLDKIYLAKVPTKYKVNFGYSAERFVVIPPGEIQPPMLFVPAGRLVFAQQDVSSLFKLGVSSTKALPSMLKEPVPTKWIRRNRIIRLTFANPDEARLRVSLYAYLTRDFAAIMDEPGVVRYCAANSIRNAWVGFIMRKTITHIGNQAGRRLNLRCLMRHNIGERRRTRRRVRQKKKKEATKTNAESEYEYEYEYEYEMDDSCGGFDRHSLNYDGGGGDYDVASLLRKSDMSSTEAIEALRFDFRPWRKEIARFKESRAREQRKGTTESSTFSEKPTQSMLGMGLVDDLENAFARTNPIEEAEKKVVKKKCQTTATIKKPLVASLRFPKKPLKFEIELETQKIFAPTLHQTVLSRITKAKKKMSTSLPFPLPLPDLKHPNTPIESIDNHPNEQDAKEEEEHDKKELRSHSAVLNPRSKPPLFQRTGENQKVKFSNVKSAQSTDDQLRTLMQLAFIKLVRLRQIGVEIEEAATSDNVKEENRRKASITRSNLDGLKKAGTLRREEEAAQLKDRCKVEKRELDEMRHASDIRASLARNRTAQMARRQHDSRLLKARQDVMLAHKVASMAKVATDSEKVHQKNEQKKKVTSVVLSSEKVRKSELEAKMNFREAKSRMQMRKQLENSWRKQLSSQKVEMAKLAHAEKLNRVDTIRLNNLRKKSKAVSSSVNTSVVKKGPEVVEDEIVVASYSIGNYVGRNCGEIESKLIAQIIGNVLSE